MSCYLTLLLKTRRWAAQPPLIRFKIRVEIKLALRQSARLGQPKKRLAPASSDWAFTDQDFGYAINALPSEDSGTLLRAILIANLGGDSI